MLDRQYFVGGGVSAYGLANEVAIRASVAKWLVSVDMHLRT